MVKRILEIDINTAIEWYKEGDFKKELALTLFTEEELKLSWKYVKTFEDACNAIGLSMNSINKRIDNLEEYYCNRNLIALYKLNIIRKALNGDWKPQLNEGEIYYAWLKWYQKDDKYPDRAEKIGEFKDLSNNKNYILIGSNDCYIRKGGLGNNIGEVNPLQSLFTCKSKEIALHLVKYFGKILFDAIYGQYKNYKWIE